MSHKVCLFYFDRRKYFTLLIKTYTKTVDIITSSLFQFIPADGFRRLRCVRSTNVNIPSFCVNFPRMFKRKSRTNHWSCDRRFLKVSPMNRSIAKKHLHIFRYSLLNHTRLIPVVDHFHSLYSFLSALYIDPCVCTEIELFHTYKVCIVFQILLQ